MDSEIYFCFKWNLHRILLHAALLTKKKAMKTIDDMIKKKWQFLWITSWLLSRLLGAKTLNSFYGMKFEIVVRVEQLAITNTHFARSAAILKEWSFLKDNHFQFFNNELTYKLRLFQLFSKFAIPFKQSEIWERVLKTVYCVHRRRLVNSLTGLRVKNVYCVHRRGLVNSLTGLRVKDVLLCS